ncbi:NAD(P)/FAD-dependent oxidoreductase [Aestuariirhabdus litorea]|uniref:NAD(P)/FAD-dependent oxidoreductase n=1 Tax=Aestuariirhabdus litorea TaxID=2528527 RepID=A0A3P3VUG7_9GAMM|nr:NAD(P)/FAD-dependent oxidoreductase [Aestuariirhabdus litorea]RRJ84403.1 NAD(P)/FAD-dependent oxidoreductase [Aestuariirhabdus litorea]RWW97627.1 aminoacetone oxidase family FAD-binding enzyme [Endozoicomonadaceae bacterium GTF-13]
MKPYDVIIIGAGASGLMCARVAGARGRRVLVLDKSNKAGKKILLSGGGRCNFTNLDVSANNYLGDNPHFCKSALSRFTQWDFISMVASHGIPWHERDHGQLFCDDSAKAILAMLLEECRSAGVEIRTGCSIEQISHQQPFQLTTSQGSFSASSLVVATGGLSFPTMGASGFGYEIARQFGHQVTDTRAGLVPFTFSDQLKGLCERLSGTAIPATLTCGQARFTEALLFTHRGMSGPAVLQISNYWQPGQRVTLDLLPSEEAPALLRGLKQEHPKSLLRTLLARHLPKALVAELEGLWWSELGETPMAQIPDRRLQQIGEQLNGWSLKPSGTEGYRTAEVTLGGVNSNELSSKTMESQRQPGLYFIGEVVDVTGWLGGYNFQWAWASGHAAGEVV